VMGGLFNLQAFKSPPYSLYCASSFITWLGLYTGTRIFSPCSEYTLIPSYHAALTYIDVSAIRMGISPTFSFYLVAIANCSSTLGRITAGVMSERVGASLVHISFAGKACWN
jgi:MFS transporter, MCT family, solute carrier family 16 (monocarboxylic acid transporters), member 10